MMNSVQVQVNAVVPTFWAHYIITFEKQSMVAHEGAPFLLPGQDKTEIFYARYLFMLKRDVWTYYIRSRLKKMWFLPKIQAVLLTQRPGGGVVEKGMWYALPPGGTPEL